MSRLYTKLAIDEIRFQGYNKLTDYLRNDRTGHIMENEFVRLYQSTNRLQAEMIVDNLKHNGINSYTTLSLPIHIMIYRDWGTPMFSA